MNITKEEILKILKDGDDDDDIKNLSVADVERTLLQIRLLQQQIDDAKTKRDLAVQFYQQFIANAKENFDTDTKPARDEIALLQYRLQRFYDANPPKGRKSHKFAAGSFGYNRAQTEYFFNGQKCDANNRELLNFCADNGNLQFVKVKEYLDWASLKKNLDFDDSGNVHFVDTGELVNGLRAQKVFFVKTP